VKTNKGSVGSITTEVITIDDPLDSESTKSETSFKTELSATSKINSTPDDISVKSKEKKIKNKPRKIASEVSEHNAEYEEDEYAIRGNNNDVILAPLTSVSIRNCSSLALSNVIRNRNSYRKLATDEGEKGDEEIMVSLIFYVANKVGIEIPQALEIIKRARQQGGIAHEEKSKKDGNGSDYQELLSGEEVEKRFSGLFQKGCEKLGIHSGRGREQNLKTTKSVDSKLQEMDFVVGLRTAFIPENVIEKVRTRNEVGKEYSREKDLKLIMEKSNSARKKRDNLPQVPKGSQISR
jgi:hypothetical protein